MRVRIEGLSDVGRVRTGNEDAWLGEPGEQLVAVCDGMGGHAKGEVASAMAVETIKRLLAGGGSSALAVALPAVPEVPEAARQLVAAVRLAHTRIYATGTTLADHEGMGTTVVALQFEGNGTVAIVNVGDSRVYRLRGGELNQLTRDHSEVSDLLADNEITPEEARTFKGKNRLSRSLGTSPSVKVDLRVDGALTGDIYLLCSDGLSGPLDDNTIARLMTSYRHDPAALARELVDEANRRGGPDNITVALAVVVESPLVGVGKPVKLEIPDSEAEFWPREKALRRLFKMPVQRERRLPWLLAGGGAAVLALVLLGLIIFRKAEGPTFQRVSVTFQLSPKQAARDARVWLDGRELVRPWRADSLRTDSSYSLRVEAEGYQTHLGSLRPDTSGAFAVILAGAAAVEVGYYNPPGKVRLVAVRERDTVFDGDLGLPHQPVRLSAGEYSFTVLRAGTIDFFQSGVLVGPGQRADILPDGSTRLNVREDR